MKRSYTLALAAILALVSGFSLTTAALARSPGHGHDRLTRLEENIDGLDLDDKTRTALHATIDTARAAQDDIRSQLQKAHSDLRALLGQDTPDEAAVLAQSEVIGTLETEHRKQTLHTLLAVRALLTPAQRASLREAIRPHGTSKPGQER